MPRGPLERGARLLFWGCLAVVVLCSASLVPHLTASSELVRLRNALLLDAEPANAVWTPAALPPDFRAGSPASTDPKFADLARRFSLRIEGDDWGTALRIGQILRQPGRAPGNPIQSSLSETYRRITDNAEGYCADFSDVFTALAQASGVFSRSWAFSFDGFGGHGHVFNEIWDRRSGRWIMLDVFNNFYFVDAAGRPLSALEVRDVLLSGGAPRMIPVAPASPPGYRYPEKAIDYYRRGLPEWYLWWGNNVFENDRSSLVRLASKAGRSAEQLLALGAGLYPHIRILESRDNEVQRQQLENIRLRLVTLLVAGVFAAGAAVSWWWAARQRRKAVHAG